MADPSNGNFRNNTVLVLKEIDGRGGDLRASVKRLCAAQVGPRSGSELQARCWECSHKTGGAKLGPHAQNERVAPRRAGIIRRTVTYSHDGDLFSCEETRNTCFLVGADVVAGENDEEVVAEHLNTVYQCAFMWRLMRHSVFPLTMITQQISLREEPIARVTTRAFQKESLPKGCLYRGHGLRCHWFIVAQETPLVSRSIQQSFVSSSVGLHPILSVAAVYMLPVSGPLSNVMIVCGSVKECDQVRLRDHH
jgi:hypothetical protein